MPASVAHMLIAHKALGKLQESEDNGLKDFAKMLDNDSEPECYQAYMNQGSLGPDLYYYIDLTKGIKDFIIDRFFQAKAITPWAYHLHSNRPNVFPLILIEITFSDTERKKDDDLRRLVLGDHDASHCLWRCCARSVRPDS